MLRLGSDLLSVLKAVADGTLSGASLEWRSDPALTVVMAANGYPGSYEKGSLIGGLDEAGNVPGVTVFHAGTSKGSDGILANGGRVLNVTASGSSIQEARDRAYAAIEKIDWPDGFCRQDIAWRAL